MKPRSKCRNHIRAVIPQKLTHLQHVQQGRLARIIEAEKQELGVLVQQAEGGEDIVD